MSAPVVKLLARPFEALWTPAQVAEFLNLSRSWVYQRAEDGTLPCLRIGGALRFEPEAIREWVRKKAAESAPARLASSS